MAQLTPASQPASESRGGALKLHTGIVAGYALLCTVMMWPLPLRMGHHVVGAKYHWDAFVNTMLLGARTLGAIGQGAGSIYDNYFFAPIPDTIAFNENLFGLAPLFAPFYFASGNPLFAYNAVLLLSLVLSSYFTFLFVRELTGSFHGALLAGVAFPYCPYAFFEMGRIQLVATQWIPLSFLFLHRAFVRRRLRDVVGFGVAYALQVGTCLYYAMFMLPLVALIAVWLLVREKPRSLAFYAQLASVGAATAGVILAMIFPYFASRKNFSLTRSEEFAGNFDGRLSFFGNVAPGNRTLTFLHHVPHTEVGAHEEIAFPGFTIALLALIALMAPVVMALRERPAGQRLGFGLRVLAWLLGTFTLAALATALTHLAVAGLVVFIVATVAWAFRRKTAPLLPSNLAIYVWGFGLTTLLFLGLEAFELNGEPVRGLYYYLHTYLPGWNGIRKVSRQAIMTSFLLIVLSGFGAGYALSKLGSRARLMVTAALACVIAFEFREAPLPLVRAPAGKHVSSAYRYIKKQPGDAPIALVPALDGQKVFRGQPGGALHNYLSLYHGRRTLNGKSSFVPPVTRMYNHAMARLPSETATRILRQLGAEYLVIHAWDMSRARAARVLRGLREDKTNYRLAYRDKDDYVFAILPSTDPTNTWVGMPEVPAGSKPIAPSEITVTTEISPEHTSKMFDGDPATRWATRRSQRVGDSVEWRFSRPRTLTAIEFRDYEVVDDAPMGFRVEAAEHDDAELRTVFLRPKLRLFSEQVFAPVSFMFRVAWDAGVQAQRVRMTIEDATPGRWWSIHEASFYARD